MRRVQGNWRAFEVKSFTGGEKVLLGDIADHHRRV
jgi:hypothetical protein